MTPRRGFTLTEILIVIALIVLIIALAVPAFNLITGSRSVDAGENLVSAMLSRARAMAMNNNQTVGVAFFRDFRNERSAMAIVVPASQRGSSAPEPPGLEMYKTWKKSQEGTNTPVHYYVGDIVCCLVDITTGPTGKKGTRLFVCTEGHDSTDTTKPPNAGQTSRYWGLLNETDIDSLVGTEYQYLPMGVGAQTINDPDPTGKIAQPRDRYLRNGLILFGPDGQLMHRQYTIAPPALGDTDQTHLYRLMGIDQRGDLNPNATNPTFIVGNNVNYPLYSQLGVVLYDEPLFKTAGGSQEDPTPDAQSYNPPWTNGITYNEAAEESWLDNNALSLMINRYNGTLVRGE